MSHDHAGHSHDHDDHGHTHVHAPANFGKAFAVGITLNLGLGVAGLARWLARRAPTARFTYGMRGSSILAALFNAVFLLVTVGGLSWEALRRLGAPEPVAGKTMMAVAAIGIVVNAVTAWVVASGRQGGRY